MAGAENQAIHHSGPEFAASDFDQKRPPVRIWI